MNEERDENLSKINEEVEKQYMSRSELIRNLQFPQSTEKKVIILPNNEGLGFRYDCYNSEILSTYISEKDFKDAVYELTKICSIEYAKKVMHEKSDPFLIEKKLLLRNIPLVIFAILLFSLRVFDFVDNQFTFEIGVAFFGIAIIAVIVNFVNS